MSAPGGGARGGGRLPERAYASRGDRGGEATGAAGPPRSPASPWPVPLDAAAAADALTLARRFRRMVREHLTGEDVPERARGRLMDPFLLASFAAKMLGWQARACRLCGFRVESRTAAGPFLCPGEAVALARKMGALATETECAAAAGAEEGTVSDMLTRLAGAAGGAVERAARADALACCPALGIARDAADAGLCQVGAREEGAETGWTAAGRPDWARAAEAAAAGADPLTGERVAPAPAAEGGA